MGYNSAADIIGLSSFV